jgi:hypothetical protein
MSRCLLSNSPPPWGVLLLACAAAATLRAAGPRIRSIALLADRLDLLAEVNPSASPAELAHTPAEPRVLGRLRVDAPVCLWTHTAFMHARSAGLRPRNAQV